MPDYTQGDTRPVLQLADAARYQENGSLVLDSRRTRPLWFDGRFLAARDLEREQNYFLMREADLARSPGFEGIQGLGVGTLAAKGQVVNPRAITIQAGQGVTPAGELVTVPALVTLQLSDLSDEPSLDVGFGIAPVQAADPGMRTGLYLIALKPIQFAANPIAAYPTTIQGPRTTHDGDMVEGTAVVLVPYPGPSNNNNATTLRAALARQIFVTGRSGRLPDSLLPLAMVSLNGGAIQWLDPYLVRRDTGAGFSGLRFGLTDPALQQAFLLEYDSTLQEAVNSFARQNLPARFAATDYFQALPPAGRFPLGSISTDGFTQLFFPPQLDVRLSIVPEDEVAALIAASMSLPPIDLTLDPSAYSNMTVFALVPVPRDGFTALAAGLPAVPLTTVLPQVLNNRRPYDMLQFYRGITGINAPSGTDNSSWQVAFGSQTYGYYIRRQSSAAPMQFGTPPPPTTAPPTTTSIPLTTTTPAPTTTKTTTGGPTTTPAPTTTPPATTAPVTTVPVTTAAPTTTPPPRTTAPAPTTTVIVRTTPPINTLRPPLTTNSPITTFSPITTISPITTVSPITTISPITTVHPITTISPITTVRPITTVVPERTILPIPPIKPVVG